MSPKDNNYIALRSPRFHSLLALSLAGKMILLLGMAAADFFLSKTSFLKFEQCSKAFFMYRNFPQLRDKIPLDRQLTFKRGHDVGELAQGLFPGGTDVSKLSKNSSEAAVKTKELIAARCEVIYEATFIYKGVLIMADILCFSDNKYTAYEVKSSLKVSDIYLKDAYLQYYVLKNSLNGFDDLFLVTLDANYTLGSELDLRKLFKKRSVKEKAETNLQYFEHRIGEAETVLEKNSIPDVAIGMHCFRPYLCDFYGTCWKGINEDNSIFNLPFTHKQELFDWYQQGIKKLEDLDEHKISKKHLRLIRQSLLDRKPYINREAIHRFLEKIKPPYAALDMEVWNPAIPQIPNSKPFEQIPFLIGFYNGRENTSLFAEHRSDEREFLARSFIEESRKYTSLVVYDKTLEIVILNTLAEHFPHLAPELEAAKHKIHDLFDLMLHHAYYHTGFGNNISLKSVSAQVLDGHQYGKVQSGLEAMSVYDSFRAETNPIHKEMLREQLNEYCGNDCKAVYDLVGFFKTL